MKFSIGDPVFVKSNNEEGVIEEFIGKDMACVKVNNKTYHAFLADMEHPYLRWFLEDKKKEKKKKATYIDQLSVDKTFERKALLPDGIYLVCMPVYKLDGFDEVVEKVKVFLYNETFGQYKFEYLNKVQGETIFSIESDLEPESQFYLHDIVFEQMANSPVFYYRFIDSKKAELDNEDTLVIKPKKLFQKLDEIKYANNAFFHVLLCKKLVPRERREVIVSLSADVVKKTETLHHFDFEQALKKSSVEIDLHIEKLVPDYKGLRSSEMLRIQLTECQKSLDLAIATHQQTLIIIHGIGRGVLKNEINSILNQTKGIKKYVNEYDVRYGYGATKVFFK